MPDRLFDAKSCERCRSTDLSVRMVSWFTEQTICMVCSDKESVIKTELRARGDKSAMEGCGYVPKLETVPA